jgi:hypothetical protein
MKRLDSFYKVKGDAPRLLCAACFLTGVVITAVYIGEFIALLAIPQYNYLVRDLEDLATHSDIKVLISKGLTVEDFLMGSKEGSVKLIADQIRRNPEQKLLVNQQGNLSQKVQGRVVMIQVCLINYSNELHCAFTGINDLQPKTVAISRVQQDYYETHECRLIIAKQTFYSAGYSMVLQKNSPITQAVNDQLITHKCWNAKFYFLRI